jgi:hypothetical protein
MNTRLSNIISLCLESDSGGGIWKRIDENREFLEFAQSNLINNIVRALALVKPEWMSDNFPRQWPGVNNVELCYNDYSSSIYVDYHDKIMRNNFATNIQKSIISYLRKFISSLFGQAT